MKKAYDEIEYWRFPRHKHDYNFLVAELFRHTNNYCYLIKELFRDTYNYYFSKKSLFQYNCCNYQYSIKAFFSYTYNYFYSIKESFRHTYHYYDEEANQRAVEILIVCGGCAKELLIIGINYVNEGLDAVNQFLFSGFSENDGGTEL